MAARTHLSLRLAAIALLCAAAFWPRARTPVSAAELAHAGISATPRHTTAVRAETTAAKLVSAPRTTKVLVADLDESDLTN